MKYSDQVKEKRVIDENGICSFAELWLMNEFLAICSPTETICVSLIRM